MACSTADAVTVLLAGEIYHGEQLRAAIGTEASGARSDADLLAACWRRYGRAGLRLINGRFAALVMEDGTLTLATDHAGTVPLYLRRHPRGLSVATEAKALGGPGADDMAPDGLPGTQPVPGLPRVHRVRAGTAVSVAVRTGQAQAMRTWRPAEHRVLRSQDEAPGDVREVLAAAVRERLGGEPVTVVLSGGIDSGTVAALAQSAGAVAQAVSLGTDAADEFAAARAVADHLGIRHYEIRVSAEELIRQLPWAIAAAEIADPDVIEYLLPLVVLYRQLGPGELRILTGYGADIPLGGMHRTAARLDVLDDAIAGDMATFDGLNELSPVLGGLAGHWTTHPFWDRAALDVLVGFEPGLKRRHGRDKWVLREAMRDLLPGPVVSRPKLGIHEGSGTTSAWTRMLRDAGVSDPGIPAAKRAMAAAIYQRVVAAGEPPAEVPVEDALPGRAAAAALEVTR
jgi:(carboxyethyl)arginine beta-lactam-synthase